MRCWCPFTLSPSVASDSFRFVVQKHVVEELPNEREQFNSSSIVRESDTPLSHMTLRYEEEHASPCQYSGSESHHPTPILKQRLSNAFTKESALTCLCTHFVPVVMLHLAIRRRLMQSSTLESVPTRFTTATMLSASRRCESSFNDWNSEFLQSLVRCGTLKRYVEGERLVYSGEPHYSCGVMLLLQGEIMENKDVVSLERDRGSKGRRRQQQDNDAVGSSPIRRQNFVEPSSPSQRNRKAPFVLCEDVVLGESMSTVSVTVVSSECIVLVISSGHLWNVAKSLNHPDVDSRHWELFKSYTSRIRKETLINVFFPTPWLLKRSWLLESVPADALETLCRLAQPVVAFPGDAVVEPPPSSSTAIEANSKIYFLIHGDVSVYSDPLADSQSSSSSSPLRNRRNGHTAPICRLHPGSTMGEMDVFFGASFRCSAIAGAHGRSTHVCDLWSVDRRSIHYIVSHCSQSVKDSMVVRALQCRTQWLSQWCRSSIGGHTICQRLRRLPLFAECSDDLLQAIADAGEACVFPNGASLAVRGDPCDSMLVVVQGRVTGSGAGVSEPPLIFGEGCLVPHRLIGDDVTADGLVDAMKIHSDRLLGVLKRVGIDSRAMAEACQPQAAVIHNNQAPPPPPPPPSAAPPASSSRGRRTNRLLAQYQSSRVEDHSAPSATTDAASRADVHVLAWEAWSQQLARSRSTLQPVSSVDFALRKVRPSEKEVMRILVQLYEESAKPNRDTLSLSFPASTRLLTEDPNFGEVQFSSNVEALVAQPTVRQCQCIVLQSKHGWMGGRSPMNPALGSAIRSPRRYHNLEEQQLDKEKRNQNASGAEDLDLSPISDTSPSREGRGQQTHPDVAHYPHTQSTTLVAPPSVLEVLDEFDHSSAVHANPENTTAGISLFTSPQPPSSADLPPSSGAVENKPPDSETPTVRHTRHQPSAYNFDNTISNTSAASSTGRRPPHETLRPVTTGSIGIGAVGSSGVSASGSSTTPSRAATAHVIEPGFMSPTAPTRRNNDSELLSRKRSDVIVKEVNVSGGVSAGRALRPFSAQARGQPSPLARMVHVSTNQESSILASESVLEPDPIWEQVVLDMDDDDDVDNADHPPAIESAVMTSKVSTRVDKTYRQHALLSSDDSSDNEDSPKEFSSTKKPSFSAQMNNTPIVLLIHVVGCAGLEGCDSVVEPVVKIVGANTGRIYMTTPAMVDMFNPSWSIEEASFITVLMRREDLTIFVCDNDADVVKPHSDVEVLYAATLSTRSLVANAGAGMKVLPLYRKANHRRDGVSVESRSKLTLRMLATSPHVARQQKGKVMGSLLAFSSLVPDESAGVLDVNQLPSAAGSSVVVFSLLKCEFHGRLMQSSVFAEVMLSERLLLRTPPSTLLTSNIGDVTSQLQTHTIAQWHSDCSSCSVESEGGILEIRLLVNTRASGSEVQQQAKLLGVCSVGIDELAFSGVGCRDLTLFAKRSSDGDSSHGNGVVIGVVKVQVLHATTRRDEHLGCSTGDSVSVVAVREFESGIDAASAPWLPDPFFTVRRVDLQGGSSALLSQSSLVFGDTSAQWKLRDGGCMLSLNTTTPGTTAPPSHIAVEVWDNSLDNSMGRVVMDSTLLQSSMDKWIHLESNSNNSNSNMSCSGGSGSGGDRRLRVCSAAVSVLRLGRLLSSSEDNNRGTQRPFLLAIYLRECKGFDSSSSDATTSLQPLVTVRLARQKRYLFRSIPCKTDIKNPCRWMLQDATLVLDLSTWTESTDSLIVEVWNGDDNPSQYLGGTRVSVMHLVDAATAEHVLPLTSKAITDEVVVPSSPTSKLVSGTLAVETLVSQRDAPWETVRQIQERQMSGTATSMVGMGSTGSTLTDDVSPSTNDSDAAETVSVVLSICGCHNLPPRKGHPFIMVQCGGNAMFTTSLVLHGDMQNPTWNNKPEGSCTTATVQVSRSKRTRRFTGGDAPVHFIVMWQTGTDVVELGRATMCISEVLNTGKYLERTTKRDSSSSKVSSLSEEPSALKTMVKTLQLRGVGVAWQNNESGEASSISVFLRET